MTAKTGIIRMSPKEEKALTERAKEGDREAIGMLWDNLTPQLFGYLINRLKDRNAAEDALQTTWLKAIEALPRFKDRGVGVKGWLFAIARNECRNHWRRSNKEVFLEEQSHEVGLDGHKDTKNRMLVDQTLAQMSEDDREILRLRYIGELSIKEIALILKIGSVATRVRLHRALSRARNILTSQI